MTQNRVRRGQMIKVREIEDENTALEKRNEIRQFI